MYIDMSNKELRAASTVCAVGSEIAKRRLGKGEYVHPGILLQGFTDKQLDEFIRICRELEKEFDDMIPSPEVERGESIVTDGAFNPPKWRRESRERRGGYRDE
jgi:hypothetical protein